MEVERHRLRLRQLIVQKASALCHEVSVIFIYHYHKLLHRSLSFSKFNLNGNLFTEAMLSQRNKINSLLKLILLKIYG